MRETERKKIIHTVEMIEKAVNSNAKSDFMPEMERCILLLTEKMKKIYGSDSELVQKLELLNNCLKEEKASKIIKEIRESINNYLKKEILFMPYKASMWDSLESVWRAATADESTIVRVVPIPYYDKDRDGSFCKQNCEYSLFPKYVPVTRYEEYDLMEHQPDMIFIHNPYDECNHVTSVQPAYYSSELKKYTDTLVYIPYFILGEIKPEDKEAIKNNKHYCTVPAVYNADKVIVQSSKMKQIYVDVLTQEEGEDSRNYWESKILGLGSPKVDKVLETNKDNIEIPVEWLKLLKKDNGQWRKVVFYNTSLNSLLKYQDLMLNKVESVLDIFREQADDVILLWRPHPLYRSTIESLCPMYLEKYDKIVKTYIDEGWGIFDDSPDMDRAVALSDAYYGDSSSVARLYTETKKCIMIQNPGLTSEGVDEKEVIGTEGLEAEEKIYFIARDFNGICVIDKELYNLQLVGKVPNIPITTRFLAKKIENWEKYIKEFSDLSNVNNMVRVEKEIVAKISSKVLEKYLLEDESFFKEPYWENRLMDLSLYISLIKKEAHKKEVCKSSRNIGKGIWESL